MAKLPITVVINTLNAGRHLDELLDSVLPHVEDVFITDSRSIDDTVDICLRRGVKIVQHPFESSSKQAEWNATHWRPLMKTEWSFGMAQDERFSPSLVRVLHEFFDREIPEDVAGATVKWRLWFMGQPLHAMTDNFRLFRKGRTRVTQVACNEHFQAEGRIVHLDGILEHKDTLTLHDWYEKQNLWTTLEAIQRVKPPSEDEVPKLLGGTQVQRKAFFKVLLGKIPGGELLRFLYYLFKFEAWRDGVAGWQWARLRVWVEHVIQIKAYEMRKHGVPVRIPEGRHGTYDPRILESALQKQLLPETIPTA